ncbi:DUF2125 domain-containing protein [Rhodospirillaceae bacterium SYSU D60014]|uniref:DUF2125 domain-containing protein n=1 Tax=Virgifigura deserti TaxID=2268457 RepID=UPI000E669D79
MHRGDMRRLTTAGLLGLLLVVVGYSIYWYFAAQALEEGITRWVAERRAEGYRISVAEPLIGGFPFRLTAEIEAPFIEAPPEEGAWRWQGPRIAGSAAPWNPLRIDLTMPGRHALSGAIAGQALTLYADAGGADGQVELDRAGRLKAVELVLADLAIADEAGDRITIEAADLAATLHDSASDDRENSIDFDFSLAGLVLPADNPPPLGREIDRIEAEGTLVGTIPPGPPAQALGAWRDAGGTLEARRLEIAWGPLTLAANGTFALDQAMQPVGAMTATVSGHGETIDALVAADIIRPRDGSIAQLILAAMSQPPENGGRPEIRVPLTAQDGYLSVGPVRLIPLPPIRWE